MRIVRPHEATFVVKRLFAAFPPEGYFPGGLPGANLSYLGNVPLVPYNYGTPPASKLRAGVATRGSPPMHAQYIAVIACDRKNEAKHLR